MIHPALCDGGLKCEVDAVYLQIRYGHDEEQRHDDAMNLSCGLEVERDGDRFEAGVVVASLCEYHLVEVL